MEFQELPFPSAQFPEMGSFPGAADLQPNWCVALPGSWHPLGLHSPFPETQLQPVPHTLANPGPALSLRHSLLSGSGQWVQLTSLRLNHPPNHV